ncbi:hypothetical protein FQR65_LT10637 [Abscondita terminalis]|nr:hypothetical protein FQR65_LT10637 [Abscondita terminalis]
MLTVFAFVLISVYVGEAYTPIVMWNGMGDSSSGLSNFKRKLETELPGVHVHPLMIGNSTIEERINTFLMHPDKQIDIACNRIRSDPLLSEGYNAIGFSQGSQFLRALMQRCPSPPMKNLVSFGGQHQGIFGFPVCFPIISFCHDLRVWINDIVYNSFVQGLLVQSTYWHNPLDEADYRESNTFLADINNEKVINQAYIDNLQQLENMILIKFEWDQMVIPTDSQWFGFYRSNESEQAVPVQNLPIYTRLGLDKLERDGDGCCFPFSLGAIQIKLNETMPNVHILSIKIGSSVIDDVENSYLMHPDKQLEIACEAVRSDPLLADGYNAVGFSQGSQFLRALAQRCPEPKMKNFISLGGQHQGVYGFPNCGSLTIKACDYVRRLLNHGAYLSWVQRTLVQATYWHDPLNEDLYKTKSTFLADINNERFINQSYINNLQALENFVMIRFEADTMVQPIESEWFGFYKPGQSKYIEKLEDSDLYKTDRLGLKQMNENNQLHFLSLPGNHLQFEWPWFVDNIVKVFLE